MKKKPEIILNQIRNQLFSQDIVLEYKMSQNDFTRKRKQSFHSAIIFMLNFLTKSLCAEIENFISFIKRNIKDREISCFTKSAFVQCRKKIKPEVFKSLSDSLVEEFYTDNEESIKLWNGFRLLAVDGSRLVLPDTRELERIYGKTKNQSAGGSCTGQDLCIIRCFKQVCS